MSEPEGPVEARAAAPASTAATRGWMIPAIIGSAMLMQTLNATVISNALPTMAVALDEDPLRLNLAITMFLLASAVFLPISGWVADKFGAKRIFMIAMVLFALSSAACGFAQNLNQLVIARIFQGMAGAMMGPVGRLVLLRTTPKNELVGAMSVLTMPALLGPVIGPVVGGAIVTFFDWRWIFFMNLPIAVAGVLLVRAYVPNVKEQVVSPIDWIGILLTGLGLAGLIFGFENIGRDALPPGVVAALFLASIAALVAYRFHAKDNPHAIIDLSIFRLVTFRASVIGGAFMRVAMGATPFLLAMLLQIGFGLSAFQAGLMTFISAAGALVMKTTAPPILRRYGFRTVLLVNAVIVGVSFMAYGFFKPSTPHWIMLTVLAIGGFFRSLQFTSLNGLAYAEIEQHQMSRASTTSSMAQQLVQSIGIGLAALLLHMLMVAQGETQMTAATIAPAFVIIGAITFISILFFIPLPKDAGDEMNGRSS
ncbi:MAG: MFS transporter [Phenylobacterium sp.]|uniref:MFS transporter n=1 Tax=Phenylobacterium sp. TaxID=1871053 RepID=UPI00271ED3FD|nr:MFS transporter [Phenylobacterium sp.]MDO8910986.1 MFS transporter [Phenylobacterium sp.]MDP3099984.1 MFS transporter [Phenylobacterium sp.]